MLDKDLEKAIEDALKDPEHILPGWAVSDPHPQSHILVPKVNGAERSAILKNTPDEKMMGIAYKNTAEQMSHFEIVHQKNTDHAHKIQVRQAHHILPDKTKPKAQGFGHILVGIYNAFNGHLKYMSMYESGGTKGSTGMDSKYQWNFPFNASFLPAEANPHDGYVWNKTHQTRSTVPHLDALTIEMSPLKNNERTTQVTHICTPYLAKAWKSKESLQYPSGEFLPLPHKIDIQKLLAMFKKRVIETTNT